MKRVLIAGGMSAAALAIAAAPEFELRRVGDGKPDDIVYRDLTFEVRAETVNEEAREVELSFASEEPYERYWGTEILDLGANSVRLGRLNNGAALLVNHDIDDQVGVVVRAWLGNDRKGRAIVRFGKSARAEEVYQDVKDGVRRLVSVGYRIWKLVREAVNGDAETYRVLDWEPYEISLVAVPADATVGVDRGGDAQQFDPRSLLENSETDDMMNARRDASGAAPVAPAATVQPGSAVLTDQAREAAVTAERQRIAGIAMLAMRLSNVDGIRDLERQAIDGGYTVERFLGLIEERAPANVLRPAETPVLGMNDNEVRRFSFVRLLNHLANPNDRAARDAAAFELEASEAVRKLGGGSQGSAKARGESATIPVDVLRASMFEGLSRDLVVGTATAGGNLVATDLAADSFIALLRNKLALAGLGATMLTDLSGNLAIPRQTGGATAYWVGENAASTESQQAFDQVGLTPKTVGAFTDMGRRLLIQSSIDVEAMVRADLVAVLALAIDLAAINGSGSSNQPRGVLNTVGIGSVAGGANGAAPTYENIVGLETLVANSNADVGRMGYLTNTKVRGKLKLTQKFASTNGDPVWERGNEMNGYQAAVSNQVPSDLTKGTASGICSAIIFGNWADLLIGMWGGLDLLVDPYTGGTAGTVRVSGLQDVDVATRHVESFSAMVDALTA